VGRCSCTHGDGRPGCSPDGGRSAGRSSDGTGCSGPPGAALGCSLGACPSGGVTPERSCAGCRPPGGSWGGTPSRASLRGSGPTTPPGRPRGVLVASGTACSRGGEVCRGCPTPPGRATGARAFRPPPKIEGRVCAASPEAAPPPPPPPASFAGHSSHTQHETLLPTPSSTPVTAPMPTTNEAAAAKSAPRRIERRRGGLTRTTPGMPPRALAAARST
jgi:hypothetical protein